MCDIKWKSSIKFQYRLKYKGIRIKYESTLTVLQVSFSEPTQTIFSFLLNLNDASK